MIIAGLAAGGGTAAAGIAGADQQYSNAVDARNAQAAYNNQRYLSVAGATTEDVLLQQGLIYRQYDQVRQQSFAQIRGVAADARRGMAVTAARNAERGIKGRSAQAAIDEFERDFLDFENLRLTELQDRGYQVSLEAKSIHARGQNVINGAYPQPLASIQHSGYLTPILQGVTTGIAVTGALSAMSGVPVFGSASSSTFVDTLGVAYA